MPKKLTHMAIAYDFDGTLTPGNMQEHSFLPALGLPKKKFWEEVKAMAAEQDMDEILAYMRLMIEKARAANVRVSKDDICKHGQGMEFFPGVEEWFGRINAYAEQRNIRIDHYIISSGLREMIKGTKIFKEFEYVFASGFAYDANDIACWPALAINYTTKTQYLFRINKGIKNSYDNAQINKFVPYEDRPIPFSNMVYLGDGETDVPCMKMIKFQGGYAVATFDPKRRKTKSRKSAKEIAAELIRDQRADYAVPADYSDGSQLDGLVKAIIDRIETMVRLKQFGKSDISEAGGQAPNINGITMGTPEPHTDPEISVQVNPELITKEQV